MAADASQTGLVASCVLGAGLAVTLALWHRTARRARNAAADQQATLQATLAQVEAARQERLVAEASHRLHTGTVAQMPLGLLVARVVDTDGVPIPRLVAANPAAAQAIGFDLQGEVGKRLADLLPGLGAGFEAACVEVAASGVARAFGDLDYADQRDAAACLAVHAFPLPAAHVGLAFANVTQERNATRALAAALETAQAATRAKGEFLSVMSHEIRTPLNSVLGMAELLAETPLTPQQRGYVEASMQAGDGLLALVNDILDLSRFESGKMELEAIEFDLGELVERVVDSHARKAFDKGLELVCVVTPDLPERVRGDPYRTLQLLSNLMSNAIKFTARGDVVLEAGRDPAGTHAHDVRFRVRDTGIGIPPDKIATIFDSFQQVDSSTTRQYGGSGLGLAICRRLARLMRGDIEVDSVLGAGSTFTVTVPFASARHESGILAAVARAVTADHVRGMLGMRCLVIDDSAASRAMIRMHLESRGLDVAESASGDAGLALAEDAQASDKPFRLVLLDRYLRGRDGLDVAARLSAAIDDGQTRVVLMAQPEHMPDPDVRERHRIAACLQKPLQRATLRRVIAFQPVPVPAPPGLTPAAPEPTADAPPLAVPRILVAEDAPANVAVLQGFLRKVPHTMDVAENGAIAVARFKAARYDLVLMDIQMPVMDGLAATAAMRAWEAAEGRDPTPIVALTAFALPDEVQRVLDSGCSACLTKPIKKAVLLELVALHATAEAAAVGG